MPQPRSCPDAGADAGAATRGNRAGGVAARAIVRCAIVWCAIVWRGLAWRAGHVRRRAAERGARALLELIIRVPRLRQFPRRVIAAVERRMLAAMDAPCFDGTHYLACNPDVQEAALDPLAHYLAHGWSEGRNPNRRLDDARYRRQARLGPRDNVSALAHWLAVGRARGLGPGPERARAAQVRPCEDPCDETSAGEALARIARAMAARAGAGETARADVLVDDVLGDDVLVDVIVPVYGGRAETLRCLASVLESRNATPFSVVVIDDRGPDARLRADLARLARLGAIELVVQPRNAGFVAAINRGMALRGDRDVVWLNADTEVYGDWLDRLRRAARASPDVATVTPLTNNGTVCSYPRFDTDNSEPLELGWDEVDRMAARVNAGHTVETPTCVGFATYVRREAIRRIGPLDEAAFGRGYGEENDFSQRAAKAGFRNLIAGDVLVRHLGQTSFGDMRADLVDAALKVVERRHPGYLRAVHRFIAEDPVAPLRRAIDVERLRRACALRRNVLMVTHSRGGGTQQHIEEEIERLAAAGKGVVLMTGGSEGPDTVRLSHPDVAELPSLAAVPMGGPALAALLGELAVTEAQVHHLADFGAGGAERLAWLLDGFDVPFDFVVHDYTAVCPRINLADQGGMYCGEPGERACRRCLGRRRSDFGAPDIRRWREGYRLLLGAAREVRVPDRDVAARLGRYFPRLSNIVVRPHERLDLPRPAPAPRRAGALRIATIGAIGPIKGYDVLLALAAEIRARGADVELTVIGYTRNDAAARAAGIRVTGPYRNDELGADIAREDPGLILIPSTWPETYCYTLSRALESGRPVAAFDIGALGTRLDDAMRLGAAVKLLPLSLARRPGALLDALLADRIAEAEDVPGGPPGVALPQSAPGRRQALAG